ncbi:DinB family protein [Paenibacillus nasutitermitis]|uniref:DinB-like domain-containing protein n=1 Tax=Paenibacillus nasutitermitis TaxID=1652958 RepID=A0A916YS97_9BACL|nr:DinB family protein [Paenibacillus nasutitermitis]GGD59154.1 hypothetical protein GCM10010911_16200 [Paenibacillus nasutitermitis]
MKYQTLITEYEDDLQHYSPEQLKHVTEQGVWSLGQLYGHLIDVAQEYLDKVEACKTSGADQPLGKTEAGEQLFRNGGFPPVRIKLPDFLDRPSNVQTKEDTTTALHQLQLKMMECEGQLDALNPDYKVEHGGFGWLNGREWFDLIEMHFRHHLRQKSELEQKLGL